MKKRKKSLVSVLTLSAAILISGCNGTDTKTNSDAGGAKGEKGELEDKIVVYSPHGKDILSTFEKQFEGKYGIDVEWLDMGSQEILDRVRSEKIIRRQTFGGEHLPQTSIKQRMRGC